MDWTGVHLIFHSGLRCAFYSKPRARHFYASFSGHGCKRGRQVTFGLIIFTCYAFQTVNLTSFTVSNHDNTGWGYVCDVLALAESLVVVKLAFCWMEIDTMCTILLRKYLLLFVWKLSWVPIEWIKHMFISSFTFTVKNHFYIPVLRGPHVSSVWFGSRERAKFDQLK